MIRKKLIRTTAVLTAFILAFTTMACGQTSSTSSQEASTTAAELVLESAQDDTEKETLRAILRAAGEDDTDADESGKSETVYVNTEADGSVKEIVVSNWLKNPDGADSLKDDTTLTDIVNTKGHETYTTGPDGTITWDAGGADIYYQGSTDKELPVEVKVSYKLDGKDIAPEELGGKSGKVTIRFDYKNNSRTLATIGGKTQEIYTPFAMISGVMLDADKFAGVKVSSGKVISDANNYVVVGYAMPGMNESLSISDEDLKDMDVDREDVDIPDYVEITAYTADFELPMTITYASADLLNDLDISKLTDRLDDMDEDIDELTDASGKLVDGTGELRDGVKKLYDGTDDLTEGVDKLADGAKSLADGAGELKDGAGALASGSAELAGGAQTLANGTQSLYDGSGDLKAGIMRLYNGTGQLADGVGAYADGATQLADGATKLGSGAEQLSSGFGQLADGVSQFTEGIAAAKEGSSQLVAGFTGDGTSSNPGAVAATSQLAQGAAQVKGGIDTLASGIQGQAAQYDALADALESRYGNILQASVSDITNRQASMAGALGANLQSMQAGLNRLASEDDEEDEDVSVGEIALESIDEFEDGTDPADLAEQFDGSAVIGDDDLLEGNVTLYAGDETVSAIASLAGMSEDQWNNIMGAYSAYTQACDIYDATEDIGALIQAMSYAPAATTAVTLVQSLDGTLRRTADTANAMYQGQDGAAGVKDLQYGAAALAEGAQSLSGGIEQLAAGTSKLDDGLGQLQAASPQLSAGVEQLTPGVASFREGSESFSAGAKQLSANAPAIKSGADQLRTGVGQLADGSDTLVDGIGKVNDGAHALASGAAELSDGAYKLYDGTGELKDGADELADGTGELRDGTVDLKDGVKKLLDGADELSDGMKEFDEEGIQKLADLLGDDLHEFTDRLQAISDAGKAYRTFSGARTDDESSVKFIIKTAAIESDKD